MNCEEISLSGFVKEMQEVSSGPHPRKFCFVLGAGASKSSGIQSGQELVDIWEKDLLERNRDAHLTWKEQLNINDGNKYEFYSQYYERRFKSPVDGYNYLEKLMESAKPSIGYVMLSYLLVHKKHNIVITTNFDHLIEDAINYYENTIPLVIGHESLSHYITKQINRPTIVKIHRDLLLDPKNRSSELDTLHENWKKALDIVFSEYHPIFIGYAGNDHSLMDFLVQNNDNFLNGKWAFPYWLLYKTDDMSEMVSAFLSKSNGYLIRHNGFDEVLCLLGAAFGYQLPSKEDFLSDAERRFQMLSDSVDKFTGLSLKEKSNQREEDAVESKDTKVSEVSQAMEQITGQAELQNLFSKAVSLSNMGQYDGAVKIYRELIGKNPKNARYHFGLGIALHELKCYEEALKEKQAASRLEPDNAQYYNSIGVTLHELKRYEEALEQKKRALELEPDNAGYYESLGVTLYELGCEEEALEKVRRALELESNNARYYNNLGAMLYNLGYHEEALKETKEGLEIEPDNAKGRNGLGVILHAMGRYEEALEEKKKAVELEPDNIDYRNSLEITLNEI